MTEAAAPYGDAMTAPFWEAAREGVLILQRCRACRRHQFYPRPFCISCMSDEVGWVRASGEGAVYSLTTVRMTVLPELEPPYEIALVDLDEGVRILARVLDAGVSIGDRVEVICDTPQADPLILVRRIPKEVQ